VKGDGENRLHFLHSKRRMWISKKNCRKLKRETELCYMLLHVDLFVSVVFGSEIPNEIIYGNTRYSRKVQKRAKREGLRYSRNSCPCRKKHGLTWTKLSTKRCEITFSMSVNFHVEYLVSHATLCHKYTNLVRQ